MVGAGEDIAAALLGGDHAFTAAVPDDGIGSISFNHETILFTEGVAVFDYAVSDISPVDPDSVSIEAVKGTAAADCVVFTVAVYNDVSAGSWLFGTVRCRRRK